MQESGLKTGRKRVFNCPLTPVQPAVEEKKKAIKQIFDSFLTGSVA